MMEKKIILCDADDTIENLCETWIGYLNRKYGTNVNVEDIVDWNIAKFFPSLTKEMVFEPTFNKEFWKHILPIDGCYNVLEQVNNRHRLYIVTATNYQTCDTKIERILNLFPFLQWSQFIIAAKNPLIMTTFKIMYSVINQIVAIYKLLFSGNNKYLLILIIIMITVS